MLANKKQLFLNFVVYSNFLFLSKKHYFCIKLNNI